VVERVYERKEVFVVGGQPTVTYNPRPAQEASSRLGDYLDECGRILCITGPSKSGKTVLVTQMVAHAIWVSGGDLKSIDDFWNDIVDKLVVYTDESAERTHVEGTKRGASIGVGLKLVGTGVDLQADASSDDVVTLRHTQSRSREPRRVAKSELARWRPPIIVDDFHHIDPKTQRDIVRGLKDLVFDALPVILVAVPHRATDVIRAEPEMTGRIEHIQISSWSLAELEDIARQGFAALNIDCPTPVSERMAEQSFGSPHLMQNFCLQICKTNHVERTSPSAGTLTGLAEDSFFESVARVQGTSDVHRRLAEGPRHSADRLQRQCKNGGTVDIYGAMLAAIALTGPRIELNWEDIRAALRALLEAEPPGRSECSRILKQMARIATTSVRDEHGRLVGDPVLEYDAGTGRVHIMDPFFAFQLRWAHATKPNW
jgi:hypothetical protein